MATKLQYIAMCDWCGFHEFKADEALPAHWTSIVTGNRKQDICPVCETHMLKLGTILAEHRAGQSAWTSELSETGKAKLDTLMMSVAPNHVTVAEWDTLAEYAQLLREDTVRPPSAKCFTEHTLRLLPIFEKLLHKRRV